MPFTTQRFSNGACALLAAVSIVTALHARAADPDGVVRPKFIKGRPVTVTYSGGRIAQLVMSQPVDARVEVPMKVEENTCSAEAESAGQSCRYVANYRRHRFELHWTKHPKKELIGKPIRRKESHPLGPEAFQFATWYALEREQYPESTKGLPADEIICDNFKWLPGASALKTGQSYQITQWLSQIMTLNLENGESDNAFHSGLDTMTLKKKSDTVFEVARVKRLFTQIKFLIPLINMITVVVPASPKAPKGELCQVTLKPDELRLMRKIVLDSDGDYKFRPYVFGSDLNFAKSMYAPRIFETPEDMIE
ncbi:MAG TPA: hypothetical protein VFV50_01650 [Bdellovibrionales bacterium]|nr:hypothetical protein [Bdellovibrionales bacterium]